VSSLPISICQSRTDSVAPTANIGNARLNGLERDLNMSSAQYSLALSCFFITYCFCEVPANLMLKKFKPSYWLGGITILWGSTFRPNLTIVFLFANSLYPSLPSFLPSFPLFPLLSFSRHDSYVRLFFLLPPHYPPRPSKLTIVLYFRVNRGVVTSFGGLIAARLALGIAEAGLFP